MVKNSQVINSIHRVINSYAQVSHNRNHRNFLKGERAPMTVFSAESFDVAVIGAVMPVLRRRWLQHVWVQNSVFSINWTP